VPVLHDLTFIFKVKHCLVFVVGAQGIPDSAPPRDIKQASDMAEI
jgi:hypothetical protein